MLKNDARTKMTTQVGIRARLNQLKSTQQDIPPQRPATILQEDREGGTKHFQDLNYEISKAKTPRESEESIAGLEDFDEDSVTINNDLNADLSITQSDM